MTEPRTYRALMLHPVPKSRNAFGEREIGSLAWPLSGMAAVREGWSKSVRQLRKKGYSISLNQHETGARFDRHGTGRRYSPKRALKDLAEAFPMLSITEEDIRTYIAKLPEINGDTTVPCTALVPVEHLRVMRSIRLADFKLHRAITSYRDYKRHPWAMELSDVPENVVLEHCRDGQLLDEQHIARLLQYPLLEIRLDVPASLLYKVSFTGLGETELIGRVLEAADSCLTLFRLMFCSFKRLAYLPGRAGRLSGGRSQMYLVPPPPFERLRYCGVTEVLNVSNNWLGLEIDYVRARPLDRKIARILSGHDESGSAGAIRYALRMLAEAYYIVSEEARFLQIIYTIDSLASLPRDARGFRHRIHIAALVCRWDDMSVAESETRFAEMLTLFDDLYSVRNKLVHRGSTFAALGVNAATAADQAARVLVLCVYQLLNAKLNGESEIQQYVAAIVARPFVARLRNTLNAERQASQPQSL